MNQAQYDQIKLAAYNDEMNKIAYSSTKHRGAFRTEHDIANYQDYLNNKLKEMKQYHEEEIGEAKDELKSRQFEGRHPAATFLQTAGTLAAGAGAGIGGHHLGRKITPPGSFGRRGLVTGGLALAGLLGGAIGTHQLALKNKGYKKDYYKTYPEMK